MGNSPRLGTWKQRADQPIGEVCHLINGQRSSFFFRRVKKYVLPDGRIIVRVL